MEQIIKKEYIDFNKTKLDGQQIRLVIKEGNRSVENLKKRETVSKTFWLLDENKKEFL